MVDRAALFVTCLTDTLFPAVGIACVDVLERVGVEVSFPREQTCCGQMHFNSGYVEEARVLAARFVEVFAGEAVVVTPSASCACHVREQVPQLLPGATGGLSERVVELSQFLVSAIAPADLGARFSARVAYHPTCHSLRGLRVGDGPTALLRAVEGLEVVPLPDAEECCGFGGTFAVKNAAVSSAMLADKLAAIEASGADVVCACDSSCLMQIGGGLRRSGSRVRAVHLAEILAGAP
jgi:L-lactate dehydrogenase complex protein LldE